MAFRVRTNPQRLGSPTNAPFLPANFGQESGVGDLIQGVTDVANVYMERKNKEDQLWAEQQYGNFVTKWTEEEEARRKETLADPKNNTDYQKISVERFNTMRNQEMERIMEERNLGEDVRRNLEIRLTRFGTHQAVQSLNVEGQRNSLASKQLITEAQDVFVNEIISSPGLWEDREQKLLTKIAENRDAIGEETLTIARAAKLAMRNAHVTGLIKANPTDALKRLHGGEFDKLLTFESKQKLLSTATREIAAKVSDQDRADKQQERFKKEEQELSYRAVNVKIARKAIKEDELVAMLDAGELSNSQFLTARSNLAKENAEIGDHDKYLDLRIRIQRGEASVEDVLDIREHLSEDQEIQLVDLADQTARRGDIFARFDIKQELDRIDQVLGGVRGPLAILDQGSSMRITNALQEARDRIRDNPDQARQIADDVIERYRPSALSIGAQLQALPRVPYWKGGVGGEKKELFSRLAEAYSRAIEDEAAGNISATELSRTLKDLERYRRLIESME